MAGTGFDKMLRAVGPLVAMAAINGVASAARKRGKFQFDWNGPDSGPFAGFGGASGVPLEQFDMSGDPPRGVLLAGADRLVVTLGTEFAIAVQGDEDARATLRFRMDDGVLHVASTNSSHGGEGVATITVTAPALSKVTIAGAGRITVDALAEDAEVVIAGAGRIKAQAVQADRLDVKIAGAGRFKAAGSARQLNLSVAGSGRAKMDGLEVESANVTIAGAGSAWFASDGAVKARLMGSGQVTVFGAARCEVHGMGSGRLVCEPRRAPDAAADEAADEA